LREYWYSQAGQVRLTLGLGRFCGLAPTSFREAIERARYESDKY